MLVLSRQRDESIMIGDDVEITIVDVRGDKVRLGITAPRNIPVHRREIYDAIQREKAEGKEPRKKLPDKTAEKDLSKEDGRESQKQPEKGSKKQPEKTAQKDLGKDS
jgi:carbon storage regulator